MTESEMLAQQFESHRQHLRAVALRILGSGTEADDAVQEAWLRLSRADAGAVVNLGGWLTTVVSRVCLDMLRSRTAKKETTADDAPEDVSSSSPEDEAVLADSVGVALMVVLDTLTPAERLAFVLHDLFAVPFDDIAPIVERSPEAARQLASRARRRVQGGGVASADRQRQQEVVTAFLAASREGDFAALLKLLHPDAVLRADAAAVKAAVANRDRGAPELESEKHGAREVALAMAGRAQGAELALIDGRPGAAWAPNGRPRALFCFEVTDGLVSGIEIRLDRGAVADAEVELIS